MTVPAPFLFAHHTVTAPQATDGAEARNVQRIAFSRGFADISYSFLVSSRGTPLEGRGAGIRGAHTVTKAGGRQLKQYGRRNWNGISHAVSLVGNSDRELSDAQVNTFRWFREWLIETGAQRPPDGPWKPWRPGVAPQHGYYAPHQEVNATGCPGALLIARLGDLNTPLASGENGATRPELDLSDLSDVDLEGLPEVYVGAGEYSQVVVYLQRFLHWRAVQYGRPEFEPGPIDGDYGPATVAAMKAWRYALYLAPDVGEWDALVKARSIAVRDGPDTIRPGDVVVVPTGTPIVAETEATRGQALAWAESKNADPVFADIVAALYDAPNEHGVNLAGAVAQSAIETGLGHFGGALTAEWRNTAGMKIGGHTGDKPEDFYRFLNWASGADAQLTHLALYAGLESENGPTRDPRYAPWVKGQSTTWEGLSGKWAMTDWYGDRIVEWMAEIVGTPEPPPDEHPDTVKVETLIRLFEDSDTAFGAFAQTWETNVAAARAERATST